MAQKDTHEFYSSNNKLESEIMALEGLVEILYCDCCFNNRVMPIDDIRTANCFIEDELNDRYYLCKVGGCEFCWFYDVCLQRRGGWEDDDDFERKLQLLEEELEYEGTEVE